LHLACGAQNTSHETLFNIAPLCILYWGNSLYLFKVVEDESGKPVGYESPFEIKKGINR